MKTLLFPSGAVVAGMVVELAIEAFRATQRLRGEGVNVLNVGRSEADSLRFPPGHPRTGVLYVGHPALPTVYYPTAQFHRFTFEHKFSEALRLLMALGARKLEVEHVTGWSEEFSAKLNVAVPPAHAGGNVEGGKTGRSSSQILFKGTLKGTKAPALPEGLVWYPHEPTWQSVAEGRLEYGLKDFALTVRYEDDFGVNAGLKLSATKAGLDLGGSFEDHQATVWRLIGEFAETET